MYLETGSDSGLGSFSQEEVDSWEIQLVSLCVCLIPVAVGWETLLSALPFPAHSLSPCQSGMPPPSLMVSSKPCSVILLRVGSTGICKELMEISALLNSLPVEFTHRKAFTNGMSIMAIHATAQICNGERKLHLLFLQSQIL